VELARSDDDDCRAHLSRIEKEATRLNSLVGELLQVTRAESDASQLHAESVDISDLISQLIADAEIEAQARGCRLVEQIHPGVVVQGDPEILRRAFENVIRNAIRYTPADGTVTVTVTPEGSEAAVSIRDTGPGVPEDALTKIFEPFYRVQTDRNRATGGVGLGLAIARRSIDLHGGRLWAENARPGLIVHIAIPRIYSNGTARA
jgi:two-component system sensor histidine kinase CpxA